MNLIQNTSIFIIALGMGLSHPANAQIQPLSPDAHHAEAYRLQEGEEMFLDGRMDEPFWDNVTPITNFTQQQPVEGAPPSERTRSEEHTSELQSRGHLVCRLLLEK